jgi:hypothetical protein
MTGNGVYSSPAIGADGTVYIGSYDHIISMSMVAMREVKQLHFLNCKSNCKSN